MYKKNHKSDAQFGRIRGFTILYAVLIASLLLSIGVSIYSLAARDFILSSAASQSQIAIFAADTGYECALYWDIKGSTPLNNPIFAITTDTIEATAGVYPCAYTADISDVAASWTQTDAGLIRTTTFYVSSTADAAGPCSKVAVRRQDNLDGSRSVFIDSRGYNTCDNINPRRVERAIQTGYTVH